MTTLLGLEAIGDDAVQYNRLSVMKVRETLGNSFAEHVDARPRRPWVAEIIGRHPTYRYERRFLHGRKDYSRANGVGSRGVYLYYHLEPGRVYEVNELLSWSRSDRYFCQVVGGRVERLDDDEVERCLSAG